MTRAGGASQKERVHRALLEANGNWINGQVFLHEMRFSQYHAVIHALEADGVLIEHSTFTDAQGFKSYRIPQRLQHPEAIFERRAGEPEPVDL